MREYWQNNLIGKTLNEDYPRKFSLCDIDGLIRMGYYLNKVNYQRLIIYESKFENERPMKKPQLDSLKMLYNSIDWSKFDKYSGLFVLKVSTDEGKISNIKWYDLNYKFIRNTSMDEFYNLISNPTP